MDGARQDLSHVNTIDLVLNVITHVNVVWCRTLAHVGHNTSLNIGVVYKDTDTEHDIDMSTPVLT